MNTIVRCPRTGCACSEEICRERHWRRKMFERGLSHRGLPLKTFRTEMSAHKHGICSMTTVVRCPRTGPACSEGACRERHWCRQLFERGLSHRGLPLKRKFRPKCRAKTRAGAPCITRVVPGKRRCSRRESRPLRALQLALNILARLPR